MKKLITSVIATLFAISMPITSLAEFWDINQATAPSDAEGYIDAVRYVESQGIVNGYPDGSYKPKNQINRAEFTKIIINAYFDTDTILKCDRRQLEFSDVPKESWFAPYICVAKNNEIIEGYSDGTFRPDANINFAEAAKIISFTNTLKTTGKLQVEPKQEPWYRFHVEYLEDRNAIPVDISSFDHLITRGEMAEIIYRVIAKIKDKSSNTYASIERAVRQSEPVDLAVGDQKGDFTLSSIDIQPVVDAYSFEGQTTITGLLTHYGDDEFYFRNKLCVSDLDQESISKIPTLLNPQHPSFCFYDSENVSDPFNTPGVYGRATVTIKDYDTYIVKISTGGVTDYSNLVSIDTIHSQVTSVDAEWNKLTHFNDGFSINIPAKADSGDCMRAGEINGRPYFEIDNSVDAYRVLAFTNEKSNRTHISTEISTALSQQEVVNGKVYDFDCTQKSNSFNTLDHKKYDLEVFDLTPHITIHTKNIANDQELDSFIKDHYGIGCSLGDKEIAENINQEGVYSVGIKGDGKDLSETQCPINYALVLLYYPEQSKVATWALGQDYNFWNSEKSKAYDQEMTASFRFL